MKKKSIIFLVWILVAALGIYIKTGMDNKNNKRPEAKTEKVAKAEQKLKYVKNSSILIGKNGHAIAYSNLPANSIVIDWYLDPFCPHCAKLEDLTEEPMLNYLNNNDNVLVRYHTLGFLSSQSPGDYSNVASSYILAVSEIKPEIAYRFLASIVDQQFRPTTEPKDIIEFKNNFIKFGGTEAEWNKVVNLQEKLIEGVVEDTEKALYDEKLAAKSPSGELFVPFVVIGDSEKALTFDGSIDASNHLISSIEKYVKENP